MRWGAPPGISPTGGMLDEAMRCFEMSIRADPDYAVAHGNKGGLNATGARRRSPTIKIRKKHSRPRVLAPATSATHRLRL